MSDRTKVAIAADRLVGTPFRMQGRCSGSGVDCAGVVHAAYGGAGYDLTHENRYAWHSDYSRLLDELVGQYFVPIDEPESCAVVTFWIKTPGKPRHIGLLVPSGDGFGLIHASQGTEKVVRERFNARWKRRVVQYWRLKEWQQSH